MRLYRMELYKLCHKKTFVAGVLATLGLMLAYFCFVEVGGELSAAGENLYFGYEAVQRNREITEEFEGEITDEKIQGIIAKYGLPSKLEENMPGWRDGNYLNDFVTRYFTDGGWEIRTRPTKLYAMEETDFGKAYDLAGEVPCLAYTTGWKVFVEMLQFGLVLGSILVICGISVIFAEESQVKMLPLIFTTEEGQRRDVLAKIYAAFTVTILIFAGIVLIDAVLCSGVYGLNGAENLSGMVLSQEMIGPAYRISFYKYLGILLGFGLQALLSLCAITLCISAHLSSGFSAVVTSAICWGFPVLMRIFFGGVLWVIADAMPVFLVMPGTLSDVYVMWKVPFSVSVCVSVGCLVKGGLYYRGRQL